MRRIPRAVLAGTAATLVLGLAAPQASADGAPSNASLAAAHKVATDPATLDTLARFFARDGALTRAAAQPRIEGEAVPVYQLSADFVAGRADAPVADLEYLASEAVASDGQKASLWTARLDGAWRVVNIASGDDETRYAALGERELPGGTVFQEPQIDAWYVQRHARVVPLDEDARRAIGAKGTTLDAYRDRVHRAYGDKLAGSAYAKSGKAGGYGASPEQPASASPEPGDGMGGPVAVASALAGLGALAALVLIGGAALRRRGNAGR
ncbi:hypothetical protein ACIQNU_07360 [Streptomyces sp. NPDC091292]|uniref:hypothetical protein n=1 Tax=Streptomyces sp. NPDC091292 TaxID=3365991 RepID=UPI00380C13FA